ncbi:2-succinyl-5-enolpyruvyl-6-hydroxy-3-cyclohexene-1-carboxylate synthase [Gracilibacillus ureilyticus]|uniref:2-succinyl-5-enolpyruvyl-6-hydroxy-3-cyclohexene-1-carboxylate synthase n=1 Tax=Gracilibacillus ureilyticus TaxID=531814 RepID=A0A1H9TRI6_9BACI|nr:2-succinyl-5-enolpyruvyl-6-hydroxy-3-cyclohexene-1-carboxylic-acid synthase [Gracilibacillus ureilyticus]SER99607.1 2-succinyl-5-enolpyruvyl-6-hydroxy-3-cyclohexene-1-carboxylate synthase [Gracilibacillus ureilyticus]
MSHQNKLTRYIANFVDQLYQSGIRNVIISPGSRSTPLALTFAEYGKYKLWVDIDERSAAFFGLGIAKGLKEAVVLVCTSGSAAANYYPAIIEAYYSRVPLIVLTADRPHELRDVGAPQAIDQIKLYGEYVKWFHEMAIPGDSDKMLTYVRNQADRAVRTATKHNAGVVHLNFPIQEPLLPDFSISHLWGEKEFTSMSSQSTYHLDKHEIKKILELINENKRGLLVCGPESDKSIVESVIRFADSWNLPVLADPLSPLRNGTHDKSHLIESYDAIFKIPEVRNQIDIDFIIRIGAMPISKPYLQFLQENQHIQHFVIETVEGYREPVGLNTHFIYGHPDQVLSDLADAGYKCDEKYLDKWQKWNHLTKQLLKERNEMEDLTEGHAVFGLQSVIPDDQIIFVGNSMPVRDMDSFWFNSEQNIEIYANRGTNGIDGIISTAAGMSATGRHTTLLIGDISFLHSMNGLLLAKNYRLSLTIVLINNNGGGIFSFLPQAKQKSPHYELLFGTSQSMDMEKIAEAFDIAYYRPENWQDYINALTHCYDSGGLSLIEIQTDRDKNVTWHQQKWDLIGNKLLKLMKENENVF